MSDFKAKRYACIRWPFLRLAGGIKFNAGFYTAKSAEEAQAIEKNEAFGVHIHPVLWEPSATPSKPTTVQTLSEADIEQALEVAKPKAHRGARGSR